MVNRCQHMLKFELVPVFSSVSLLHLEYVALWESQTRLFDAFLGILAVSSQWWPMLLHQSPELTWVQLQPWFQGLWLTLDSGTDDSHFDLYPSVYGRRPLLLRKLFYCFLFYFMSETSFKWGPACVCCSSEVPSRWLKECYNKSFMFHFERFHKLQHVWHVIKEDRDQTFIQSPCGYWRRRKDANLSGVGANPKGFVEIWHDIQYLSIHCF